MFFLVELSQANKPKDTDSFIFRGFHHLSAIQKEGLMVWDGLKDRIFKSRPYFLLGTADGPERLNKVLKGFEVNNWGGGRLEQTMMREFMRSSSIKTVLRSVADASFNSRNNDSDDISGLIARQILHNNVEECGTVEATSGEGNTQAQEVEEQTEAVSNALTFPPLKVDKEIAFRPLTPHAIGRTHRYYNLSTKRVWYSTEVTIPRKAPILQTHVQFHNYLLVNGRRTMPTSLARNASANSALIKAVIDGRYCVGEVMSVLPFSMHKPD
ncbi:hypothetical protein QCA50_017765 [Cerrena zonata]|uniref:Uncharacterized protein n=1 Tax=Cerrena zonata TaxID=2478898 RepID=A0AAW0FIL6_9APHY